MTRRIFAISARVGIAFAGLLLAVILLLVLLLGTQTGSRLLWSGIAGALDGLSAESVDGRFGGPLSLKKLRYETESLRLTVDSLQLDWAPARLLSANVLINSLSIDGVSYTQLQPSPPTEDSEPFLLPERLALPVAIELRMIALRSLEYRSTPEAEALRVDEVTLAASYRGSDLTINSLTANGPLFGVQATASARTQGDYPSSASVDWRATLPDLAPLSGRLLLDGDLSSLQIEQTLDAPYSSSQKIEVLDLLGELRVAARIDIAGIKMQEIADTLPEAAVAGAVEAEGTSTDLLFNARVDAESPEFGSVKLVAAGDLKARIVTLERLLLTRQPDSARLEVAGRADLTDAVPSFDLKGSWDQLGWPLAGEPQITADTGLFSLEGHAEDYTLSLNTALTVPGQTGGQLSLAGRGGSSAFELEDVQLALLDGSLGGHGELRWKPQIRGSLTLDGEGLNPVVLAPDFPGNLGLTLRADGGFTDGAVDATIDVLSISGSFRDKPVDVQLKGRLQDTELRLSTMDIASGGTQIRAAGSLNLANGSDQQNKQAAGMDLQWSVNSPDLGDLLPSASGSLTGAGVLGGSLQMPTVSGELEGDAIAYADYQLERLLLDLDVDLTRDAPSRLELTLEQLRLPGIEISKLALSGKGNRGDHRLALQGDSSQGAVQLSVAGDLQVDRWQGEMLSGELRYEGLPAWNLAQPQSFTVGTDAQQLEQGCWNSLDSRLCLRAQRADNSLDAALSLSQFGLDYLQPLIGDAISLTGTLDAQASIRQQAHTVPEVVVSMNADSVELRTGATAEQPNELLLGLQPSQVEMSYGDAGLLAQVSMPVTSGGGLDASAQIDRSTAPLAERPLRGTVALSLDDIGFLSALSSEIENAAGALNGDLDISGTLASPLPVGQLRLLNGSLGLAAPGLDISDIGVSVTSSGGQTLDFDGQATSGEGSLRLSGSAVVDGAQSVADIEIQGDGFQAINTPDVRAFISPDLQIALRETGVQVSGQLRIPRAEITPQELPESVVSASTDQVIIRDGDDKSSAADAAQSELTANIRVILGDAVSVEGFGLKGRLTGGIAVTQSPGQPTLGSGEINIQDGEYRAYGQGLVIDRGKILFAGGPISEPGLNVRALRRPAEGIVVGVSVRGPLQQPDFSVFSEPGMTQSEQLSWLVLGRPLDGASEGESSLIAQAALALGLKGGNFLADRFGSSLGVDSVGIETGSGEAGAASDASQAALVIGKYLSPDLFVSYGIGLFDSISTIKLEYSVTDNWKVSTESSTLASGGDVTYTKER